MKDFKPQQLQPLSDYINELYHGDPLPLAHSLDDAIYYLHHMSDERKKDLRFINCLDAVKRISDCLKGEEFC